MSVRCFVWAAVLLCAFVSALAGRTYDPNCDAKYRNITADHTMCIAEADVGTDVPLDQATKELIVKKHNEFRAAADPPATDMNKLEWSEELALVAGKWARQCKRWGPHDQPYQKMMPGIPFVPVGQNAARFADNGEWSEAMEGWFKEKEFYKYGSRKPTVPGEKIGHYTQVMAATSQRIGCARAHCPNDPDGFEHNFICNYAPWGNVIEKPYTSGEQGSACQKKTAEGLCDCGDKMCYNDGTLNTATCTCTCAEYFTGDTCKELKCPREEKPWYNCANRKADCAMGSRYHCPLTCGLCQAPCGGKKCHGGVMNWDSCECQCQPAFSGETCETLTCPEADTHWLCPRYKKDYCLARINGVQLRFRCLHKCGLCPQS